jgi:hypothetical protein
MNPNEPDFGGLRFTLRVEDPLNRCVCVGGGGGSWNISRGRCAACLRCLLRCLLRATRVRCMPRPANGGAAPLPCATLRRRGYAEDVFEVQVPRPPRQGKAAAPVATA